MRCSRHRYVLACDLQTGNRTVPVQTSNSRVNTLLVLLSSNQFNLENQAEYMTESKLRPPSYFMDVWDISARTRNVCMCVYACVCLRNWYINCLNFRIVVIEPYERERFKSIQPGVEKTRENLQTFHLSTPCFRSAHFSDLHFSDIKTSNMVRKCSGVLALDSRPVSQVKSSF